MRRMYSENQLIELIKQYAEVSPEDIQDMFDDGEVSLAGKYVRIMDAPTSTTLTDEQIAQVKEGVFIQGSFLGLTNPIFLPAQKLSGVNVYQGIYFGTFAAGDIGYIGAYQITSSKVIERIYSKVINLSGINTINGKAIPNYPADTGTFTLKCVNGVLTWVADA